MPTRAYQIDIICRAYPNLTLHDMTYKSDMASHAISTLRHRSGYERGRAGACLKGVYVHSEDACSVQNIG